MIGRSGYSSLASAELGYADASGTSGIFLAGNKIHLMNLDATGDCVTCDLKLEEDDPLYSGERVLAPVGKPFSGFLLANGGRMDLFLSPPQKEGLTLAEAKKHLEELSSKSFKKRKAATEALVQAGPEVAAWLARAKLASSEAAQRLEAVLQRIREKSFSYDRKGHVQLNQDIQKLVLLSDQRHWVALVGDYPHKTLVLGRIDEGKPILLGREEVSAPILGLEPMPDGSLLVCNANGTISFYRVGPEGDSKSAGP